MKYLLTLAILFGAWKATATEQCPKQTAPSVIGVSLLKCNDVAPGVECCYSMTNTRDLGFGCITVQCVRYMAADGSCLPWIWDLYEVKCGVFKQ